MSGFAAILASAFAMFYWWFAVQSFGSDPIPYDGIIWSAVKVWAFFFCVGWLISRPFHRRT